MPKQSAVLPDTAWNPLARQYRAVVSPTTEASDNYHLGVFLTIAGTLLGRSVYVQMGMPVYPNFFCSLYGQSSHARKGTAMRRGLELMEAAAADEVCVMYGIGSAEGFVDALSKWQTAKKASTVTGIVTLSELRVLIDKANQKSTQSIIPILCEAFDCGPKLEIPTRHHTGTVYDPFTAIMGGSSPQWMRKLQISDLEGGIGNRFLWIPGEPKELIEDPPPVDPKQWKELIKTLQTIRDFWKKRGSTRLVRSPEAQEQWKEFYRRIRTFGDEDPLVGSLADRMHVHAAKTSLLYAALEKSLIIQPKHQDAAMRFAEYQMEALYGIFSEHGVTSIVQEEQKLLEQILKAGPGGIPRRKLQQMNWRMGTENFNRRIKWMLAEGAIREQQRGRSFWIMPARPEEADDTATATPAPPETVLIWDSRLDCLEDPAAEQKILAMPLRDSDERRIFRAQALGLKLRQPTSEEHLAHLKALREAEGNGGGESTPLAVNTSV